MIMLLGPAEDYRHLDITCRDWEPAAILVRRHWALYIESAILPEEEKKAIRASVESGMKYVRDQFQDNAILTRIRSAGPPFMCFAKKAMKSHTAY
ncbi:hypothetical protein CVT25_001731 [Psilocybe cyanescens]|uniref:Uncharacterized protein n=1 Tax=Psilocybe cyanescens TaxID=93625 RepID=A0A409WPK5_PSICY|nr:hypothetical protein CVT25_001731 [Psilocybe cyanescens]